MGGGQADDHPPGGPAPSGGARRAKDGPEQYGALRAIDPTNGEVRWEHRFRGYPSDVTLDLAGGATSTASGVVFSGDNEGYLNGFESASGKLLWRFQTGAPIWGAPPITYMLEGRQWVVVPSGVTITAFALPDAVRESGSQGRRPGPPRVEPNARLEH